MEIPFPPTLFLDLWFWINEEPYMRIGAPFLNLWESVEDNASELQFIHPNETA